MHRPAIGYYTDWFSCWRHRARETEGRIHETQSLGR